MKIKCFMVSLLSQMEYINILDTIKFVFSIWAKQTELLKGDRSLKYCK